MASGFDGTEPTKLGGAQLPSFEKLVAGLGLAVGFWSAIALAVGAVIGTNARLLLGPTAITAAANWLSCFGIFLARSSKARPRALARLAGAACAATILLMCAAMGFSAWWLGVITVRELLAWGTPAIALGAAYFYVVAHHFVLTVEAGRKPSWLGW